MMFKIVSTHGQHSVEFDFDPLDDFEVLRFQTLSLFEDLGEDFVLLDFAGRELTSVKDLDELRSSSFAVLDKTNNDSISGDALKLFVWVVDSPFNDLALTSCSSRLISSESEEEGGIIQPRFRIIDTQFDLCMSCKRHVSSGLLVSPNPTMTSLQPFRCCGKLASEFGLTLDSYQQHAGDDTEMRVNPESPAGKYLRWHYIQAAVDCQSSLCSQSSGAMAMSDGEQRLEGRLRSGAKTVQVYEDFEQQRKARECIDFAKVCERAEVIRTNSPVALAEDALCVKALLEWFKHDFFKWFKKPNCPTQGCPGFSAIGNIHPCGGAAPTPEERQRDWAGTVEVYKCHDCQSIIRFPRVNNPSRLLETRLGRCGEFANAFCLICRSLGIDANWVLDFTDHVWVEVFLPSQGRYVHADPCEKSLDAPLTYEVGWNKSLNYIFSFSRFGVTDVINRYSRKFSSSVCQNRSLCSEKFVKDRVKSLDHQMQTWYYQQVLLRLGQGVNGAISGSPLTLLRFQAGISAFAPSFYTRLNVQADLSMSEVLDRKCAQKRDLHMLMFLQSTQLSQEEMQGRISGDKQWKESRGEAGLAAASDGVGASGGSTEGRQGEETFRVIEGMQWLHEGMLVGTGGGKHLEIFVSSVGNDDETDNSSNHFTSDIARQHARWIGDDVSALDRVLSPYRISVDSIPVLPRPGRGHNVALLCAHSGAFVASQSFDTWGSDAAGDEMVSFLQPYLFPLSRAENKQRYGALLGQEVYVMVVTVLDSGENGGVALEHLVKSILASGASTAPSLPGHRESWVLVAYIGEKQSTHPSSESEDGCKNCTGNLVDVVSVNVSGRVGGTGAGLSIAEVREVIHCSSSPRSMGPTMAKVCVALLPTRFSSAGIITETSTASRGALIQNQCLHDVIFKEVDMHVASVATQFMESRMAENLQDFVDRVKAVCVSDPLSRGFVITSLAEFELNPSTSLAGSTSPPPLSIAATAAMEGGTGAVSAFLFSSAGFPLHKMSGAASCHSKVFVKSLAASDATASAGFSIGSDVNEEFDVDPSDSTEQCVTSHGPCSLRYVSLGGKHHPDTVGFDTTLGLSGVAALLGGPEFISDVHLADVCFSGDDIAQSVRCRYFVDDHRSCLDAQSHCLMSSASPPVGAGSFLPSESFSFEASKLDRNLDRITSVSIKHGDLVDSITLRYQSGRVLTAGGAGGSTSRGVAVNVSGGERVMGFFGGIGGHIHHFGVILYSPCPRSRPERCMDLQSMRTNDTSKSAAADVVAALLKTATKSKLRTNCLSLDLLHVRGNHLCVSTEQCSPGKILGALKALRGSNETAVVRKCLQTALLYTVNITKNSDDVKFCTIKLSNQIFLNFILSVKHGLDFFLSSPVLWQVSYSDDCLHRSEGLTAACKQSADTKRLWIEAMTAYCSFLTEVLLLDQFKVAA